MNINYLKIKYIGKNSDRWVIHLFSIYPRTMHFTDWLVISLEASDRPREYGEQAGQF